jgi:hypothetical protein
MTSRARLFSLYARREAMQAAGLGRSLAQALSEGAAAQSLSARLQRMAQEVNTSLGPALGAELRASGFLATSLVEEAERQNIRANHANQNVLRLGWALKLHDHRRHIGETAAAAARLEETHAAEARAEATRPPRRVER